MAVVCELCGKDMATGESCVDEPTKREGETYTRVAYGSERDDWGTASRNPCHDCNVNAGGFHHLFCDVERCPRCGGQNIGCDCEKEWGY